MNVKHLVASLAAVGLAVGLTSTAAAQSAGPTGGQLKPSNHQRQGRAPVLEALTKVNLSPEEKAKVKALVKTRNDNVKTYRDAHKGDRAAVMAYMRDQQKVFMDGIKAALTPEHYTQFQQELKTILQSLRNGQPGQGQRQGQSSNQGTPPPASGKGAGN